MKRLTTTRFIACWLLLCPIFCVAQNITIDSLALVSLYNATDGINWKRTWDLNQPMNTWQGVTLNDNGRVDRLSLGFNDLTGSIPPEIGNLSSLTYLSFAGDDIIGDIPPEIGNLTNLTSLSFIGNELTGSIPPEIGNLTNLTSLSFIRNALTGSIPSEIGNLINLTILRLESNQLTGNIPPELGNLNNLQRLYLEENQLTGPIPAEIGDLPKLRYLYLHDNELSGCYDVNLINLCNQLTASYNTNERISAGNNFNMQWESFCDSGACTSVPTNTQDSLALVALYNATDGANWRNVWNLDKYMSGWYGVNMSTDGRVVELDLTVNQLSGSLPPQIGDLTQLTILELRANYDLIGNIPPEIGNLTLLNTLDLANNNKIDGNIPPEIGNLVNLETLDLSHTKVSGNIPTEIGNLINLSKLDLSSTGVSSLPSGIGGLVNLTKLDLSQTKINGNVPPEIGNLSNLTYLDISSVNLTGNLPPQIGNLNKLTYLNLLGNFTSIPPEIGNLSSLTTLTLSRFTASIPSEIGNLNKLTSLRLSSNQFIGHIPPEIGNLTNLVTLDINGNELNSPIPAEIGNLTKLTRLDLSRNQLTGAIPSEIGNLNKLTRLSLYKNQLSDTIPSEIGNLTNLTSLGLSNNQFIGTIPLEIRNLTKLRSLALYTNQLTGDIPQEIANLPLLRNLWIFDNQLSGCYDTELTNLCTQLSYPTNANISDGNNFETRWEYFCDISAGVCGSESLCRQNDSLLLVELYHETAGDKWTNTWNLNQPMDTWHGITLNADGCVTCIDMDGNHNCMDDANSSGNNLDGHIPTSIIHLKSLTFLNLSDNHLSGGIPLELADADNLIFLGLANNELGGTIPEELGNMGNLTGLTLSDNQLYGCYGNNLTNLCVQLTPNYNTNASISDGNNFEATWEDFCNNGTGCYLYSPCREKDSLSLVAFYEAVDLDVFWDFYTPINTWGGVALNGNGCVIALTFGEDDSGGTYTFPPELFELSNLEYMNFGANNFTGSIPPEIGNLTKLKSLSLGSNYLSGEIPTELWTLTNLENLDLMGNKFTGNIPPGIKNLANLRTLNLWSNQLDGDIPTEIGNLPNLETLYLRKNQFTGNLPASISNLTNLKNLYLDGNQLTGNIPDLSTMSNLTTLDIQNNKFSFETIQVIYNSNSLAEFTYSPQYHGEVQSYIVALDTTLTIGLSPILPGNNNQNVNYQWKRNDKYLSGATDSTLLLMNIQPENVGEYVIYMTDSTRVPDLEIISEPIYVMIPGYDLFGQPVVYNQIMMEFDSEADKKEYEDKYVNIDRIDLAATVKGSCDCNRLLYLWDFPNDSIALEVFLEVNTRRESIGQRRTKVDGGLNNIFNIGPIASGEGWTWTGNYPENYPDSVLVFLLDSGTDTLHWDASPYLLNDAPVDSCYNLPMSMGFNYTDTVINNNFVDSLGHGTYGFRSIAEGLDDNNINLKVVPLKVFDKEGEGTLFNFVCALYHAIDHGADIIHLSAGYTGTASGVLENAIALSKEKGCLLVTAAGNDGMDIDSIPQYPAYYAKEFYTIGSDGKDSLVHYDNVIPVASINPQDELSDFSNYSQDAVLLSAYGEDMNGYSHTGESISSSGSSVSAFYVTRELAVEIAKNRNRTYQQIWQDFETNALRDCPATEGLTKTGKCLDIGFNEVYADLRAYLEGTYDTTIHKMRNDLNMRYLLPGQVPVDSTLNHNLAIQPYTNIPPYYQGNESVPGTFSNYPDQVVDWILVSLRAEKSADTELSRTAAWLLNDGNIQLLQPLFEDINTAPDSVYVVIEHRNHLWTMSPQKIPIDSNIITWDFTTQDGYRASTTTGQIQVQPGIWAMLAGDSKQDDIGGGDINSGDKIIWQNDNGKFLLYLRGDYNLNGDTNGQDKEMWEKNNGKFSGIPK